MIGERVLVTGAAGFLGSHLVDALLKNGHDVLGVDNLFTGSKLNLEEARRSSRFEFMRHDVTFPLYVEVDFIFNLASPASPIHYQRDPVQTIKTNIIGSTNLLGLAKRLEVPIFQASTSEVYGDPEVHPQTESYWGHVNPIGPRACYDEGKRAAETLFFDYMRQHQLDVRVVRIFNTYGPRMAIDDGRVISNFIVKALRGDDLVIAGDGKQTRSFCFYEDMISGFMGVAGNSAPPDGPLNIGNPHEVTIEEIAALVLKLSGSKSRVIYAPSPTDDPKRRRPSISKLQEYVDWEPTVALSDGVDRTIEYFRSALT